MTFARFALLVGGASLVVVAGGAGMVACSSSSGGLALQDAGSTTHDSSSGGSGSGSGGGSGSSSSGSDSGSSGDDGGASSSGSDGGGTCENPPKLFTETKAGVYCPFSAADGGTTQTCAAGQTCCETPSTAGTPSTCVPAGTACPVTGSISWQCEEAIDCVGAAGGPICCGTATSPTTVTSCGVTWAEWTGFGGTACATTCAAPSFTVCEQNSDCTGAAGTTCTPSKADGNDFGFCTP